MRFNVKEDIMMLAEKAEKKVYSPQEEKILYRVQPVNPNRAIPLIGRVRGVKPQIDIERGYYFTESFKETEGQPLILRWAKALAHYAEKSTVVIEEGQLIAGRGGTAGRYGILYQGNSIYFFRNLEYSMKYEGREFKRGIETN